MIDKTESTKRKEAWENAKASCMLETGPVSAEAEVLMQKYIAGNISAKELDDLMMQHFFKHAVN